MKDYLEIFWCWCQESTLKLILAIPAGTFFFYAEWWRVIVAITFLIVVDTALGIWVALKYKRFSSWRLSRISNKISRYALAMFTAYFLGLANPALLGWVFSYLGTFFVLTEAISNFEKLSLLGLTLPTKLLSKINEQYKRLAEAENGVRKDVALEIIRRREDKAACE